MPTGYGRAAVGASSAWGRGRFAGLSGGVGASGNGVASGGGARGGGAGVRSVQFINDCHFCSHALADRPVPSRSATVAQAFSPISPTSRRSDASSSAAQRRGAARGDRFCVVGVRAGVGAWRPRAGAGGARVSWTPFFGRPP